MDARPPYPAANYFQTKSGSYIVDINQTRQGPDKDIGVYSSVSTPNGNVKDNSFEHEFNETKFSSETEQSTRSQRSRLLQGQISLPHAEASNDEHVQDSLQEPGSQEGGEEKNSTKLKFSQFSRRSKYTFLMLAIASFGAGCGFSLSAPFYPREAEKKGASQTVIGFVFSSFQLVNFIACPVVGNYLTVLGAKFVYTSGIMIAGTTAILFGFLDKGPSGTIFVVMSFLVRSIEALGTAAFSTAGFAIISNEFPNHIASVFATLETCIGVGLMVGPTIGGALYEVGGFGMPFWVVGAIIILNGLAIFTCLPPPSDTAKRQKGNVFSLLKSSMVWVTLLCVMVGASGMGFMDPTLSNHLEQFGLSTVLIGLFFVIVPGIYAVTAPLWGYLSDTKDIQSPLLVGGSLVCALGFILMGPSPLFSFLPRELWTVTLGLVCFGLSVGCAIVPTMKCMVIGARDIGFDDSLDTYGLVAGLFNSTFYLGAFFGPTIGGALVDQIGFYYGSTIIAGFYLVAMIVSGTYFVVRRLRRKRSQKSEGPRGQDTTQSATHEMPSNEKAPLISSSKTKVLDNSYSATAYTQPELTGQTQTNATGQTQTNGLGQTQTNATGQTQTNASGQTQTNATGQTQANTTRQTQTNGLGQTQTNATRQTQTNASGQKQTNGIGQIKTTDIIITRL